MTISNRAELIETRKQHYMKFSGPALKGIREQRWELYGLPQFLGCLDWLSEQGFRLVPGEPTEEMVEAYMRGTQVGDRVTGFKNVAYLGLYNATGAGDILRENKP